MAAGDVLVVVDMQGNFLDNRDRETVKMVEHLIKGAIQDRIPIVVLEYDSPHKTISSIRKLLRDAPIDIRHVAVTKYRNDGSTQVRDACRQWGLTPTRFFVCGVYFAYCVKETSIGLTTKFENAEIIVLRDATDALTYNSSRSVTAYSKTRVQLRSLKKTSKKLRLLRSR